MSAAAAVVGKSATTVDTDPERGGGKPGRGQISQLGVLEDMLPSQARWAPLGGRRRCRDGSLHGPKCPKCGVLQAKTEVGGVPSCPGKTCPPPVPMSCSVGGAAPHLLVLLPYAGAGGLSRLILGHARCKQGHLGGRDRVGGPAHQAPSQALGSVCLGSVTPASLVPSWALSFLIRKRR